MKYLKSYKLFENYELEEDFERDAIFIALSNAIDNNNIDLVEGVYRDYPNILNPIFKEGLKILTKDHGKILETLSGAAVNKNDEVVKILINTKYVQETLKMGDYLEFLFMGGIAEEIDFNKDNITYDTDYDTDDAMHYYSNTGEDYGDYDTLYGYFIKDVKNGVGSRIYTQMGVDRDGYDTEEEYVNGFGVVTE